MSYKTVAENSKNLARKYVKEKNFGRAFSHYLVALKLTPDWKDQLQEEFSTVLCEWGTILDAKERYSDLFNCYEQAVEIYPNNVLILNNLGAHLLRCGLLKEAAHYFRKCVDIDRYFIRATHNLESVANMAVERWHFRMLNDEHRNEAFREAIIKKVKQGFHTVLDVGTGTGILSLFCVEGKAEEIYACDSSPVMCDIAERVFMSNNAVDVKLIPKHSSEVVVGEDIRQKISLLVTETFDAALLGEDILNTLSHAWQNLLLPSQPTMTKLNPEFGLVLPVGAVLYATGLEMETIANDLHLRNTASSFLLENCNIFMRTDNYDTQDLSRCRYNSLTETRKLLELNFNDPSSLAAVMGENQREIALQCVTSGRLDCIAVWFDLHLDEDIVLNSGPGSKNNTAWDQAVFPLPRSIPVQEGQNITLNVTLQNGKLNINLTNECEGFELSQSAIAMLKADDLGKVLQGVGRKLAREYNHPITVLDCFPFPLFGFSLLIERKGEKFADKMICYAATEGESALIDFLAKKHGVDVVVLIKTEDDLGPQGEEFDVILLDLMEGNGEIKDGILLELDRVRSLLKPNGTLLPQQIKVIGRFLHSPWLDRVSKVLDNSVTCGYNIAEFINTYQVRHFIDLDLKAIEKTFCTDSFELFDVFDTSESVTEKTVALSSTVPAHVNAFSYWFKIKFLEGCGEISTDENGYHQAAFLFDATECLKNITFNVIRNNELFNIEILKR